MRILITMLILGSFFTQLDAQVKHELKIPILNILSKNIHPSYEMVSQNEKIGIEIGAGLDLSEVSLLENSFTPTDTFVTPGVFLQTDQFRSRVFKVSIALKYYWYYNVNETYFSIFAGPAVEFDNVIFLEDEYLERRNMMSTGFGEEFIGKKEIRPGLKGGVKTIFKNNLVMELSLFQGILIEERFPNELTLRRAFITGNFGLKFGYRFGQHPLQTKVK